MVGKQRLSKIRPRITLTIFPLLVILLAVTAFPHRERIAWLAVGLCAGGLLGVFGLRKTVFEATAEGFFYTPYAHLGIALSLLFIARIVYRVVELLLVDPNVPQGMEGFAQSSLTLSVFGLLAGYYIVYAIGLARWRARVIAKQRRESENQTPGVARSP
jgi:ABC-type dipeptide/oligopeptide/nickel transport system permease subunit